jgi:hypothetical protein
MICTLVLTGVFSVVNPDPYPDPDSLESLDPDPDPDSQSRSGSRRAKITHKNRDVLF